MKENLYYLFISGIILGSGPCFSFCAPIMIGYTFFHKPTWKGSLISYLIFSFAKLIGYMLLGIICALGAKLLQIEGLSEYSGYVYATLGFFIIILGLTTILGKNVKFSKVCAFINEGNVRNVGMLGFLIGISPCLPLIGILNYIVIISKTPIDAIFFILIFGVGTVLSPLMLLIVITGKTANVFLAKEKSKLIIKTICGLLLIFLGVMSVLKIFVQ